MKYEGWASTGVHFRFVELFPRANASESGICSVLTVLSEHGFC
jgi:hypothetical protein